MVARKKILVFIALCSYFSIAAQENVLVIDILFKGLNHTKKSVALRELDFQINDSIDIANLATIIDRNEKRLLSTGLFNLCDINIKRWDEETNSLIILIEVKENLYIYPAPIFELADRNFNVWIKEMNASFKRVNYGVRLDHLNLTGNKDKFKFIFQTGYTRKYEGDYKFPYLYNNWGLNVNMVFSENKEIGYKTQENKILFKKYSNEEVLLSRFRTGITASHRLDVFTNQFFKIEYNYNKVNDKVINELNPFYYPNGDNYIQYLRLEYVLKYNRTVFPTYPEGGYAFSVELRYDGLGFGNFKNSSLAIDYAKYFKPTKRLIAGFKVKGKTNFGDNVIPYSNNVAIGYGTDGLRGYELYVADGTAFCWAKTEIKFNVLDKMINLAKYMPLSAFKQFPIRVFARWSTESGYAYERTYTSTNSFNNRWLIGYGPALDILLVNNFLFSIEYNYNHTGESGVFYKSSFNF